LLRNTQEEVSQPIAAATLIKDAAKEVIRRAA